MPPQFMEPDEYILLMDVARADGSTASEDDFKRLYDAGVRTTQMFYNDWGAIEPERGRYEWGAIDRYLERAWKCNFKAYVMCFTYAPKWMDDTWYAHTAGGVQRGVISPWNPDAVGYMLEFYQLMRDRYTIPGASIVMNSWLTHGETMFLNEPAWFDPAAQASFKARYGSATYPMPNTVPTEEWLRDTYINLSVAQQAILIDNPNREIWTQVHPVIAQFPGIYGNGCKWLEDVLSAYRSNWPDANIGQIYYTWIQWGQVWQQMRDLSVKYSTHVYGGSEYAEGLPTSTPRAIANGCRGQLCGVLHPFTGHTEVLPWMVDNIKAAMKQWRG